MKRIKTILPRTGKFKMSLCIRPHSFSSKCSWSVRIVRAKILSSNCMPKRLIPTYFQVTSAFNCLWSPTSQSVLVLSNAVSLMIAIHRSASVVIAASSQMTAMNFVSRPKFRVTTLVPELFAVTMTNLAFLITASHP